MNPEEFDVKVEALYKYIKSEFGVKFANELWDTEIVNELDDIGWQTEVIVSEED